MFREVYVSFVQLEDCGDPEESFFNNSHTLSASADTDVMSHVILLFITVIVRDSNGLR